MATKVFTEKECKNIKNLYLRWQNPTEIAGLLSLSPLDVHNYLQSKYKEWESEDTFCEHCGVPGSKHPKCSICDKNVHDDFIKYKDTIICYICADLE